MRILLFVFIIGVSFLAESQNLHEKFINTINTNPQEAQKIAQEEIKNSKANTKEKVDGMNDLGNAYYYLDEYDEGLKILKQSALLAQDINYPKGTGESFVISGNIHFLTGQYAQAIQFYTDGLQAFKEIDYREGMAQCYNGIGTVQYEEEDYEKALDFFKTALKYGGTITKSDSYVNMARIFLKLEAYSESKMYAEKAYKIGLTTEDLYVQSYCLDILGEVHLNISKFELSKKYFLQSLDLKTQLEDGQGTARTKYFLGVNYKNTGEIDTAMIYLNEAYEEAEEIGANEELKSIFEELAKVYAIKKDYNKAFEFQTKYIQLSEGMDNEKATKKIAELELAMTKKNQNEKLAAIEKERENRRKLNRTIFISGIIVLVLLVLFSVSVYKRYRQKKSNQERLEAQNEVIQGQKKEILDSIHYANRIQTAILPSTKLIDKYFENFILYKPKDIIGGDFYWMEESENQVFFAVADCTGHGIPGALVSVVCINALNRCIREFKLEKPADILNKTTELVIEQFQKNNQEIKDGMDISLITVQKLDRTTIQWAGAHNPFWLVRSVTEGNLLANNRVLEPNISDNGYNLFEIKADKQPIGSFIEAKDFTNWEIKLTKNDTIYLNTDGFADQFGGDTKHPGGKKLMAKNLKLKLLNIQHLPIHDSSEDLSNTNIAVETSGQKEQLNNLFENHKGEQAQVDDVCISGLRLG